MTGGRRYPSALKLPDFSALSAYLDAHVFNFGTNVF
jgi:hypothetical protein